MQVLEFKDVSLGYENRIILKNINLSVEQNDYFCIVGSNGSGKSTLMQAMLGLKKVDAGEIIFNTKISRRAGYLAQQKPIHKYFPASVKEVVLSGTLASKSVFTFFSSKDKRNACEKMERLGILHLSDKCISELSGGERQKALLARALCTSSNLLFLDEPAAGLDEQSQAELHDIISGLHKSGATIVAISHDMDFVQKNATRILCLGEANEVRFNAHTKP